MNVEAALAVIAAYLMGSVDFGVVVAKVAGVDIFAAGSGNPGASNVLRTMGKGAFALTLVGDIGKGVAAAALGSQLAGETVGFACLLAVVVGHCYPVFHRFRGGKGVASGLGALLWLIPIVGVAGLVVWLTVAAIWKMASLSSLLVVATWVPAAAVAADRAATLWTAAAVALILWRHRGNLARLKKGEERKLVAG